jgi:hypothetical protein
MDKAARKEEERSAGRWLLAAALLLGVPLALGVPFLLLGSWIYELTGPDIGVTIYGVGLLGGALAMLAGTCCLIAGAIIYISAESRPR